MPDNKDKTPKATKAPIQPKSLFGKYSNHTISNPFGNSTVKETSTQHAAINPDEFEYVSNVSSFDSLEGVRAANARLQGKDVQAYRAMKQFGTGVASGIGQSLINLIDVTSWGNDTFESSLFGVSTTDLQNWNNGVMQRNQILRDNPGSFSPTDFGWYMEQLGSTGTGVGMAFAALGETIAIEAATGGAGTGAAIGRLAKLFKDIKKLKGTAALAESYNAVKDLRSAATIYATLSRSKESRMDASQTYNDISKEMAAETNEDGSLKYTKEQVHEFASKGASRDFWGEMALLPLDILSFRTMVYNPISGVGEGLIERGLSKIAGVYGKSKVGKAAGWMTTKSIGATTEGVEEGFQSIMQNEGHHYAKVLGGVDDGTGFMQRLGANVKTDEFWNNFAGGVIGSPIIGGAMNVTQRIMSGNRAGILKDAHNDFIKNVAKVDSVIANKIVTLTNEGKTKEAEVLQRQFRANKSLGALHIDAMTDKSSAFESHLNFMESTLEELNKGNTSALTDLGFNDPTPEHIDYLKVNLEKSISDAKEMQVIYNNVKNKYNKNFVPQVAVSHFQINRLQEAKVESEAEIGLLQGKLFQFGQLSANGRVQYNAEYELTALIEEQKRLTELFRVTENEMEKENVNNLIKANQNKIVGIKDTLSELGKNEAYTQEQKELDNDIIQSALKDQDYAQAIYDKEHIENAIALERRNLILWNNPKYQQAKTQESIKKSKNKAQLKNNKDAVEKAGATDPATATAIAEKEAEILAQEVASAVSAENQNVTMGNGNLFEEDSALIDKLKGAAPVGNPPTDTGTGEPEFIFSPTVFNFDESSEEAKTQVIDGVNGLVAKLGENPSFEDLVRHIGKVQGLPTAESIYNALKWGWEKTGHATEDYDAIYSKIFKNPLDKLMSGIQGLATSTVEEIHEETEKITNNIIEEEKKDKVFDSNNQVINYAGVVTNEPSSKMAFVSRLAKLLKETNEDGSITIDHEYVEDDLATGIYVDSLPLLDPDNFIEGTELEIRIPTKYLDSIKIPVYNADGTKGQSISFGQYVAEKNLTPEMQEYQDKVPMIIYQPGNPKGLAFVHDVGWYNVNNFNQMFPEDMKKAIEHTRKIRAAVLSNEENSVPIIITGKRQTTFAGLKLKEGEEITLKEANPQMQLTIARTVDSLSTSKTQVAFPNNETILKGGNNFKVGDIYDVRRYGLEDGVKTYQAFPVTRPKISEAIKESILKAIDIYANRQTTDEGIKSTHKPIIAHIQNTMGLDITTEYGIKRYLKHFIYVFEPENAVGDKANQIVEQQAKTAFAEGTPYISFVAGGNIVFGQAGIPIYVRKDNTIVSSLFINPNSPGSSVGALAALRKGIKVREKIKGKEQLVEYSDRLGWYETNLDFEAYNNDKPVVLIDKNLSSSVVSNNYKDFVMSNLKTNIRSVNIGTEAEPNYVTNIQPIITYDLKSNVQNKINNEKPETVATETTETKKEDVVANDPAQAEIDAALEEVKRLLGNDFGKSSEEDFFSPEVLTDKKRDEVAEDINSIAGLRPDEQFDLVNFIYNQITDIVNLDVKQVTKTEVYAHVDTVFNAEIEPTKKKLEDKVKELQDLMVKFPAMQDSRVPDSIKDLELRLQKIKAIKANIKVLKEEAFNRVAKYTGITENRVHIDPDTEDVNENDDRDNDDDDAIDGKEISRDFWADVLQENPESRLSYTMRRFFGQIRQYDTKGNPMVGFLGLPTYTGADVISRKLMVLLADVPSDFKTMMAKLETMKDALPWMQEVINRLNAADRQTKNQFVTVMSNTQLRTKFTMLSYNRKTSSWNSKVYDAHTNGISEAVKAKWKSNMMTRSNGLIIADEDGNYIINKDRAKFLMHRFESWKGVHIPTLEGNLESLKSTREKVRSGKATFTPTDPEIERFLKTNLVSASDRVKLSMSGYNYQIVPLGNNQYRMEALPYYSVSNSEAGRQEVKSWLSGFGISLTDKTVEELFRDGLVHNGQRNSFSALFDDNTKTNGLFGILYNRLKSIVDTEGVILLDEDGKSPLQDSVVVSLANLESKYNDTEVPFGYRDNGKSFFALSVPKFVTDRTRDLKGEDTTVIDQLSTISFSKNSFWLTLLKSKIFKNKFQLSHMADSAFKEMGKKLYKDNSIANLPDVDHEHTKLGMFMDTTQGEVTYEGKNSSGQEATLHTYPGTNIKLRMATMFSPTMSDKHMMTMMTTAILDLQSADLLQGEGISKEVIRVLYDQTVKPELERMIKFYQNGGKTDIKNYDKGAGMFLLMPAMNEIEYTPGLKLIDAIKKHPFDFNIEQIEKNNDLKASIAENIKGYVSSLVAEKLAVWTEGGLIQTEVNKEGQIETTLNYFDKTYTDKFSGKTPEEKSKLIAADFVINNLVANANSFMVFGGDPALYFKEEQRKDDSGNARANTKMEMARDTFVNAGKRLANQIAPGTALSDSENEKYLQIFLDDRKSVANNLEYLKQLAQIGGWDASAYENIEGSDAQEYTTWREHLDILAKLGKTPDMVFDITPQEISEARELFASGTPKAKLTDKQRVLISKVMQPIKPVYTGQIYDPAQDVMRTMYIKTSSFPLIPQLTTGLEIDKLRVAMEKIQDERKLNVRASYQSGNKVGAIGIPKGNTIWNPETGNINDEVLNKLNDYSLVLDRKNFRIQQEVPFKSGKTGDDKISLGTQLMKLLFGDEMMNFGKTITHADGTTTIEDAFMLDGKPYTGKDLQKEYNQTFIQLVLEKKNQLFDELGLDESGNPIDMQMSMVKLQSILEEEAKKRGYPLQDIKGLKLDKTTGQFNMPLWASANSNRYESMLNSIVGNRLIKMKFPGNSFVVGSEEGFKMQENLEGVIDESKIIYTSAWDGTKGLQASYHENGKIKKAQVLIASKFKDNDGKLIDLFTKVNGEYKYITHTPEGGYKLKEEMFSPELLSMLSFRIPTSGHQSASQIEIVGFIPGESADLMIVPKNFTKQKGLDFDVDKENSYQLWNFITDDGKFEVLNESHRSDILARADRELQKALRGETTYDRVLLATGLGIAGDYTEEQIKESKFLVKLNSKISEKILQNKIIKIGHSVFANPNLEIQSKISKTLNTDFAEQEAMFIDGIVNSKENKYWTPLSDEYQKQKMIAGASGKTGTGAYSLDVVFHSLIQQSAINGTPIQLTETIQEDGKDKIVPKTFRFGAIESDGILGKPKTLDGGRTISEVMAERQNVAVDNEKLQVMGRVNLNGITMDVDKVMNMLGFDKGEDGHSISLLFLSQPIIKDFVKRLKNANSTMAEYIENKEDTISEELIAEYFASEVPVDEEYWKVMSRQMTNQNFIAALKAEKPDGALQAAVLRRFMELRNYGLAIRNVQTTINTDSKGLGKSFFDVIEKRNALNNLGKTNPLITGVTNLLGDYIPKAQGLSTLDTEETNVLLKQGYVDIGDFLVKPTTLSGGFNFYGVTTAYNLWNKHFPYNAGMVEKVFNEIIPIVTGGNLSARRSVELKQKIFQSIKKYGAASPKAGIISFADDVNQERQRLFVDSDTNTSLASYLKELSTRILRRPTADNPITEEERIQQSAIDKFIKRNNLLNRFEYDIQTNGQPSLIKFNNAAGEEFDEQYLYESLATLIQRRGKTGSVQLPKIGNKEYTLDTLAQDLIAYCYLGNATQEAIQFTKYVPMSYLNTVGYGAVMRRAGSQFENNPNILRIKNLQDNVPDELKHLVSEFTMQFVQHNPERVSGRAKMDVKKLNKLIIKKEGDTFIFKDGATFPFVSVYDSAIPKGQKKFRLYWFDGSKYVRIPVLGVFGMDEYQPGQDIGKSIVNDRIKLKAQPQAALKEQSVAEETVGSLFSMASGDLKTIVNTIIQNNTTKYTKLAEALAPYIGDTKIVVSDTITTKTGNYSNFRGSYNLPTNTIFIHPSILDKPDVLADTILHELVHSLTVKAVKPHVKEVDGELEVNIDAPLFVTNLVRLYNQVLGSSLDSTAMDTLPKLVAGATITDEQRSKYYGLTSIYEFMSMALTDAGFQEELNKIPYKDTGMTLLERFKQIVSQILESLGVKFDKDFTAAHAISAIFDVIENNNPKSSENKFETMFDEVLNGNGDTSFLDKLDNELGSQDNPEMSFSPATKEDIINNVREFINSLDSTQIKNC